MGNSYGVGLSCSLQQHTGSHILEPQKLRAYLRVHVSACYTLVLHVLLNVNPSHLCVESGILHL